MIAGYERERAATDARLAEAARQLELQTKLAKLHQERAEALAAQAAAEAKARGAAEKLAADREKENDKLKSRLGRSRKIGVVAVIAAFILGVTR